MMNDLLRTEFRLFDSSLLSIRSINHVVNIGLIRKPIWIINTLNAIIYFIIINLIGFVLMYIDKKRAKDIFLILFFAFTIYEGGFYNVKGKDFFEFH